MQQFQNEIVRLVLWVRVVTTIYEANDTTNVSQTHEKYRYETAFYRHYKTIILWWVKTQCILQL